MDIPLTVKEENFLLFLLKKKELNFKNQNVEKNTYRFNLLIKRLEKNDLITKNYVNDHNKYTLTPFGEFVANCLAKLSTTPEKLQNHKLMIRWFYLR